MMAEIKSDITKRFPMIQLFFYEPTYPRKHLTVLLIGPWLWIVEAKKDLEEEANKHMEK